MLARALIAPAIGAVLIVGMAALPTAARAGDVTGQVKLPLKAKKPPIGSHGFIERRANPVTDVLPYDPRPEMVVVLDGGPVGEDDAKPQIGAKWLLLGTAFEIPLKAVVVGSEVELRNGGHGSPVLYSPDDAGLIPDQPISPGGVRAITIKTPFIAYEVRARKSAHLRGWIIGVPHRYFSRLSKNGNFEIKDVPEGQWKVKVWHRNGWLTDLEENITVKRHGDTKVSSIRLPDKLDLDGPAGKSAGGDETKDSAGEK